MFTMARIKAVRYKGKEFFLNHLSANDYYSEKEKITGVWHGKLADDFQLQNMPVTADVFSLFQQNLNPVTLSKLTQRTVNGGIRFYDFQCSVQKSVSVMSLFDSRLIEAHKQAVAFAMNELEQFAAVRIRYGENVNTQNYELTGKMIYSSFHHDCSRTLDPQLHTHNVVCNVTGDSEGNFKALENAAMCKAIQYCGRVYQNSLAMACRKLGYEIRETLDFRGNVKGFEIENVPEEILDRFSKRTNDIDEEIVCQERALGRTLTAAEKHEISLATRSEKMLTSNAESVRKYQLSQLSEEELELLQNISEKSMKQPISKPDITLVLQEILPELFERQSVMKEEHLMAEILRRNLGIFTLQEVRDAIEKTWEISKLPDGYITLQTVMEAEQYTLDLINRERGICKALNPDFILFPNDENKEKQRAVIQEILQNKDRFMLLRGVAGSGKTTVLKELAKGVKCGLMVLAPTNSAADVLNQEGFTHSQTVASFLQNPPVFNGLLIVDEAGLCSLKDGVKLLHQAEKSHCRILFVGDSRQHTAVDRGDFFRLLEDHSNITHFELREIYRQQIAEYRRGVQECTNGNFTNAFQLFDKNGYICESNSAYLRQAAEYFAQHLDDNIIAVAPTHKECDALTEEIRKQIPLGDVVQHKEIFRSSQLTNAQLRNHKNYVIGDNIMFIRRMKGVAEAGTVLTVVKVQNKTLYLSNGKQIKLPMAADFIDKGASLSRELRTGDIIQFKVNLRSEKIYNGNLARITDFPDVVELLDQNMHPIPNGLRRLPDNFAGFDYGWVTTSHKSQGRTAKHVVIAAERLDRRAFYVACSRGRQSMRLFCPEKEFLKNQLCKADDSRHNAADLLPPPPRKEYLSNDTTKFEQHQEKYAKQKEIFDQQLAAHKKERKALEAEKEALEKNHAMLCRKIFDYKNARNLPWHQRLRLAMQGKIAITSSWYKNAITERDSLHQKIATVEAKINSIRFPQLTVPKKYPLTFSQKLIQYLKTFFKSTKPLFTDSESNFVNAWQKSDIWGLREYFCNHFPDKDHTLFENITRTLLAKTQDFHFFIPISQEQYKVFRKNQSKLFHRIELLYDIAIREKRQKQQQEFRERMQQQIAKRQQEIKALAEIKTIPAANVGGDLLQQAKSFGYPEDYDRQNTAKEIAKESFIRQHQFAHINEAVLTEIEPPPMLTVPELVTWYLSRHDREQLEDLLQLSIERQKDKVGQDILEEERRTSPMTGPQKELFAELIRRGLATEIPSDISKQEASKLIAELTANEPLAAQQINILKQKIQDGLLPYIPDGELQNLTQKEFSKLLAESKARAANRSPRREDKSRIKNKGIDI